MVNAPTDLVLPDNAGGQQITTIGADAFKDRNIVDAHSLERCYQAHMADKENREEELFRFMMLEMWLQKEIDTEHKKWVYEAG